MRNTTSYHIRAPLQVHQQLQLRITASPKSMHNHYHISQNQAAPVCCAMSCCQHKLPLAMSYRGYGMQQSNAVAVPKARHLLVRPPLCCCCCCCWHLSAAVLHCRHTPVVLDAQCHHELYILLIQLVVVCRHCTAVISSHSARMSTESVPDAGRPAPLACRSFDLHSRVPENRHV